jgi:hypothetical protein
MGFQDSVCLPLFFIKYQLHIIISEMHIIISEIKSVLFNKQ